jgi:glutathione S-transferase
MAATLYVVPGSPPCAAVAAALEAKGIVFRRVDLPQGFHWLHQRVRFGRRTVPSLTLEGRTHVGSREILRALDAARPDPPLLPADPALRDAVLAAEAWGDEVLQDGGRRILWMAIPNAPTDAASYLEGSRSPIPRFLVRPLMPGLARLEQRVNAAGEAAVRADLRDLPGWLDRVDGWIADGVIGADPVNAADLQISSSVRLLGTLGDLRPQLDGRPADALAHRRFPVFPGDLRRGAIPSDWFP